MEDYNLLGLAFFTQRRALEVHPSCCVCVGSSFLRLRSIFHGCGWTQFTSPLLKGIWADFRFWLLQIKPLWLELWVDVSFYLSGMNS